MVLATIIGGLVFVDRTLAQSNIVVLADGWRIQSSAQLAHAGEKVATTAPRERTLPGIMRGTNGAAIGIRPACRRQYWPR